MVARRNAWQIPESEVTGALYLQGVTAEQLKNRDNEQVSGTVGTPVPQLLAAGTDATRGEVGRWSGVCEQRLGPRVRTDEP